MRFGFDPQTFAPTYRLNYGSPGSSLALEIATRSRGTPRIANNRLRWVRDYDSEFMQDRSVVNTYAGFRAVEDVLVGWDETNKVEVVSTAPEHHPLTGGPSS